MQTLSTKDTFETVIHDHDDADVPYTILVKEGAANDVAAYIVTGQHCDADMALKRGGKLTEAKAREFGANWPRRLTYRR